MNPSELSSTLPIHRGPEPVLTSTMTGVQFTAVINKLKGVVGGWSNALNWDLGHAPAPGEALLLGHAYLVPMPGSQLDGSFTTGTLSFDTGGDVFAIDASTTGGAAASLTLTGGANALGGTAAIALSATTTGTITLGGIAADGMLTVAFGSMPGTIDVPNGAAHLVFGSQGLISGTGGIVKTGAGTLALGGSQPYTGPTQINGGALRLDGVIYGGTGPGSIDIGNGGSLILTRSDSFGVHNTTPQSRVTIETGGVVTNAGPYFTTFVNLTINGGELRANGGTSPVYPAYQLKGTVTVGGTGVSTFSSTASVNQFTGVQLGDNTIGGTTTFSVTNAGASLNVAASLVDGCNRENTALVTSGLIKNGPGTMVVKTNNYTGTTTINAGVLSVSTLANGGAASGVGASSNAAANLTLNGGTLSYSGPAQNTDRLFTLGVNGGTLDTRGGFLNFTNPGAIPLAGAAPLRTLTLTGFNSAGSLSTLLADSGASKLAVVVQVKGSWALTNANTYTGGTTINQGTLIAGHPGENGTFAGGSTVTVNQGGVLLCVGTDALGFYWGYANLVIHRGAVTTDSTTGNHTTLQNLVMTGGLITSQSTDHHFFLNGPMTTNADSTTALIDCPQFELGPGWPTVGSATITVAQGTPNDGVDLRIDSQVYNRALTKNGPGTLQLTNTDNFYDGATTINGGLLSVFSLANGGANSGIGRSSNAATNLVINGGTLQYLGTNNASTDRNFILGPNGGTLDASGTGSLTYAGHTTNGSNVVGFSQPNTPTALTLTGTGLADLGTTVTNNGTAPTSVTKSGSGTWILNTANSYTGATVVSGGTLVLDNSPAGTVLAPASPITVTNATLRLTGNQYNAISTPSLLTVGVGGVVDAANANGLHNAHTLGNTLLQGGTLMSSTGADPGWGNFVLNNNATLTANGDAASTISAHVFQVGNNTTIN
ncbi:MAG: beta strand repeat-containing protein, partial [Chthoniobacter sp.]